MGFMSDLVLSVLVTRGVLGGCRFGGTFSMGDAVFSRGSRGSRGSPCEVGWVIDVMQMGEMDGKDPSTENDIGGASSSKDQRKWLMTKLPREAKELNECSNMLESRDASSVGLLASPSTKGAMRRGLSECSNTNVSDDATSVGLLVSSSAMILTNGCLNGTARSLLCAFVCGKKGRCRCKLQRLPVSKISLKFQTWRVSHEFPLPTMAVLQLLFGFILCRQKVPRTIMSAISFSHVHLYVDKVEDLQVYKDLERQANNDDFPAPEVSFVSQNRDVVKQMIVGLGFRVTRARYGSTRSVLVTSKDPRGVQFVVSAADPCVDVDDSNPLPCWSAIRIHEFMQAHNARQGIAVLGFRVDNVDSVYQRYLDKHPALVGSLWETEGFRVLDVYAYYKLDEKVAERGTMLRFVEAVPSEVPLPGLEEVEAIFDSNARSAYCDHWVSNVFSRTEFLDTLHDTLGFTPKVDFNAGVVAAGEAQIESTVTGNTSENALSSPSAALRDQSQVYLPINNALSEVGHVHGFLKEIGQGIQHIASRVDDLVAFVQHANDQRMRTGEGFTFLHIPRSYYGILTQDELREAARSEHTAEAIGSCLRSGVWNEDGSIDLAASKESLDQIFLTNLEGESRCEYLRMKDSILRVILDSRFKNVRALLGLHLSENTYLGIVRNQVLVDIQGGDILFQIFTSNILQREANDEAPFLEFIERVCSECTDSSGCPLPVRPGCGGFGIRNFLTLFLSIEVSKAMREANYASRIGNARDEEYARARVDCFTRQLNEANPILTAISDAMTAEGKYRDELSRATLKKDTQEAIGRWQRLLDEATEQKEKGNSRLMECSAKYNEIMRQLRQTNEYDHKP